MDKKTIIVYRWNSYSEPALIEAMKKLGIDVVFFDKRLRDFHADAMFAAVFMNWLHHHKAEAAFSFDYFPLISSICEVNKIPYLAWIYDCPMYTLMSPTLSNSFNYIFCFDEAYAVRLQQEGAKNCFHFPLGVAVERMEQIIGQADEEERAKFRSDISFVGKFYNGSENHYRKVVFEEYTRGWLEGLIEAQRKIYGYNFVRKSLPQKIIEEIIEKCEIRLGKMYCDAPAYLAADVINIEIAAREREDTVALAAEERPVALYTPPDFPEKLAANPNILNKGYVNNATQMPLVFHESRINLNVTSRTIETGIPQRVLDILACGGFCLTAYQPEIDVFFKDGQELVMYTDGEDFLGKLRYFLEHEQERRQIAQRGKKAVRERFSLKDRVKEMLEVVGVLGREKTI